MPRDFIPPIQKSAPERKPSTVGGPPTSAPVTPGVRPKLTLRHAGNGGDLSSDPTPYASIAGPASKDFGSLDAPIHRNYRRSGKD